MSLFNVFEIAGSGMSAQSLRLNTTASNLSNAESVSSSSGETYKARYPVFEAMLRDLDRDVQGTGVSVTGIIESNAPIKSQYQPDHPMSDENGYIFMPNVNVVEEMTNMISASRSYQTNVEMVNTSKQMLMRTLGLGE